MVRIPPERGKASRMEPGWVTPAPTPISPSPDCWRRPTSASATNWSLRHRWRAMDTTRARQTSSGDLASALDAFEADADMAGILGKQFVETFLTYKRNELERFHHWVTDWEFASTPTTLDKRDRAAAHRRTT